MESATGSRMVSLSVVFFEGKKSVESICNKKKMRETATQCSTKKKFLYQNDDGTTRYEEYDDKEENDPEKGVLGDDVASSFTRAIQS